MTVFVVTRQRYWGAEGDGCAVEIAAGSKNYASPDALVEKYPGEWGEFDDPREAVATALAVRAAWMQDGRPEVALTVTGSGGAIGVYPTTDDGYSPEDLIKWGNAKYEALPKCQFCGGLGADNYTSRITGETYVACSDLHAQEVIHREEAFEEEDDE